MVEAFLQSIIKGVEELGWSSSKKIAEHTDWFVDDVDRVLKQLAEEKRVLCRKKGRGFQYGPLETIPKEPILEIQEPEKKEETISIPPPSSDTVFQSIDDFMLQGILALPKDKAFRVDEFATEMLKSFPLVDWSKDEIIQQIAKLVRLNRLEPIPFLDLEDHRVKYEYVVK